jgi:hypothetical protein
MMICMGGGDDLMDDGRRLRWRDAYPFDFAVADCVGDRIERWFQRW